MKSVALYLSIFLLFSGCASQVKMEYDASTDFSGYKHFTWVDPEIREIESPILDSELLTDRVKASVKEVLTQRGYIEASEGADFFITYHTASKEKLKSSHFSVGVGYGHYYGRWGQSVIFDGPDIRSYEEGVPILDIINSSNDKLVWRSWNTSLVTQKNYSPIAVKQSVEDILSAFPPSP